MRSLLLVLLAALAQAGGFVGKVESVEADSGSARVLPAGGVAMTVQMGQGDLAVGWVGRQVRGELIMSDGKFRLERIFPAEPEALRRIAEATDALRRDTVERGRLATRATGDLAPGWMLWDQSGQLLSSADLRGKPIVLNFIFTRCHSPAMCPAATASMSALAKALRGAGLADKVHLLSISFDPAYDSPGVLRAYADSRGIDAGQHRLLTGDRQQIKDLMAQFGIQTIQADGTIVHNAATLLITPEGRIAARQEGPRFEPGDLLPLIRRELGAR